jgi:hypothetical protein
MTLSNRSPAQPQGLSMDKFFYFFAGLRKGEIRQRVAALRRDHPDESPEQLARRLVKAHVPLSVMTGLLLHLPMLVPGVGQVVRLLGMAGTAAAVMQLQMALILEIALCFGRDIDDRSRLTELAVVMAAAGLTSGTPLLVKALGLRPWLGIPSGTAAATALNQLVGEAAIRYYRRHPEPVPDVPLPPTEAFAGQDPAAAP